VTVENPQYITSQPWPFPASVMLGFTAVATSTTIDISKDDIDDCQWFSREQLAGFSTGIDDEKDKYKIGSGDSISSYLITAWKNKEIGQY
jgi:NAD+ diphosphatase